MKPAGKGLLQELYRLMEEEILQYYLLIEEMKKESAYLRKGSTDLLMESLHSLEVQTTTIRKIHESIQKTTEEILIAMELKEEEKNLSTLLAILPVQDSQRIKNYQRTLESLKKWISQINARNKTYIQESLAYWKDLFSLIANPLADSPIYIQNGKKQPAGHLPYSLNRKV